MWRDCMARAYAPEALFARYRHQLVATYPNRLAPPNGAQRASWSNIRRGLRMLRRVLWQVGVRDDFRRQFWKVAGPRLIRGDIEAVIRIGLMAHHLVLSGRDASAGRQNASHYSIKTRELPAAA